MQMHPVVKSVTWLVRAVENPFTTVDTEGHS